MTIRSRATFRFPRPNVGVDHPLWEQIRKYPEGFEIRVGETCEAPEWIKDDGMFALAQRDGNLIILDPPDPPEACWTHPEGADKDPIIWRGFRGEFEMLHEKETASVRLARSNAPRLIAQCTYEGFDGLGSWALSGGTTNAKAFFEELATRAGLALGAREGVNPLDYWLHQTWLYLRTSGNRSIYVFAGDLSGWYCQVKQRYAHRLKVADYHSVILGSQKRVLIN